MTASPTHMKWWGWGDEQTEFDISDKPEKNAKKIDKAVQKMFKDFPPKA